MKRLIKGYSVTIHCAKCQRKLRIKSERFGMEGNCPVCREPFLPVDMDIPPTGNRFARATLLLSTGCLGLIATSAVAIHLLDERWSLHTLLIFGPRWLLLVPPTAVLPFALWKSRAGAVLLGVTFPVWILFVSGAVFRITPPSERGAKQLRIVTFNVQGGDLDTGRFEQYLAITNPDVVLLQECQRLNATHFAGEGWHQVDARGLFALSRLPIQQTARLGWREFGTSAALSEYQVELDGRLIKVVNVHLPTVRSGLEAVIHGRLSGLEKLQANRLEREHASQLARSHCQTVETELIVAGDFNMPVESSIYRNHWGDLANAFSLTGRGFGATKATSWHQVRIDHVLYDRDAWNCVRCEVGPDLGSDHLPVFAVLECVGRSR